MNEAGHDERNDSGDAHGQGHDRIGHRHDGHGRSARRVRRGWWAVALLLAVVWAWTRRDGEGRL